MTYDVIIIGAGPAGSAAAIGLARQGRCVALIEKAAFPRRKVCGEFMSATSVPVLERLGIGAAWRDRAGPEVRRLSLFAADRVVPAPMPRGNGFGRALGRDILDVLLRDEAERAGTNVMQPARATGLRREDGRHVLEIECKGERMTLRAPVLVAAHGSWEPGALPTQPGKDAYPGGLLGFKAHFTGGHLEADTMPLLAFPGGYGGIVWEGGGRLSLSCCLRRDVLASVRRPGESAGTAVQRHLVGTTRGIAETLEGAELSGPWLAAGPIRPGIRARYEGDVFRIGNVAGEAHPVIAEGISMALQSAWLLTEALKCCDLAEEAERARAGALYAAAWRRQFAGRIHAAGAFAQLAMRPATFAPLGRLVQAAPAILTLGARLSGKSRSLPLAHDPA